MHGYAYNSQGAGTHEACNMGVCECLHGCVLEQMSEQTLQLCLGVHAWAVY